MRRDLGIPATARVLVLAGRVENAQKGHFGMLGLLPRLRTMVPEAHMLVVGDGPDLRQARDLAGSLGLGGGVTFTGMRHDMPELLATADIAVVPSLVEDAFPFAALEAAATGLPVAAFRCGGLPEAVRDGETGLIVDRADWVGLCDALALLLRDSRLASALGEAGSRFAETMGLDNHVATLMEFLEEACRAGSSAERVASRTPAMRARREQ
jgi:glycosyltransferase involved in cell wall biosynthesis